MFLGSLREAGSAGSFKAISEAFMRRILGDLKRFQGVKGAFLGDFRDFQIPRVSEGFHTSFRGFKALERFRSI